MIDKRPTSPMSVYPGNELELFAQATRWKSYYARTLRRYLHGDVLEVGAGLGGTVRFLCHSGARSWTCLEPDATLAERLTLSLDADPLPVPTEVRIGTVAALADSDRFDTATYIDVLEHIADDAEELTRVLRFIRPGGALVVLAPAHQWLFSPFDAAIGHYRRYTAKALANLRPAGGYLKSKFYLDSIGLLASIGNRLLLKSSMPTPGQIAIWDRCMVPLSRWLDPLLGYRVGKTVVGVWIKDSN